MCGASTGGERTGQPPTLSQRADGLQPVRRCHIDIGGRVDDLVQPDDVRVVEELQDFDLSSNLRRLWGTVVPDARRLAGLRGRVPRERDRQRNGWHSNVSGAPYGLAGAPPMASKEP